MNKKITRNKLIITAIAGICVITGVFMFFNRPEQVEAGWWDDTWLYRKSVAVTNNTTAESSVYIAVTITGTNDLVTAGKMQADCGDLRWTEYNGIVLPYYIVSGCNTASTVVHVELETFPAGAQTLYYYYGNPSAADGFEASDFSTNVASNYTVGSTGSEEKGPGPVGYWSFDEGYGDTAYDSTDNGNDGDLAGSCPGGATCPTWQTEDMCVSGKCLHFDGTDDYVDCGNLGASIENWTQELWLKTTVTNKMPMTIGDASIYLNYGIAWNGNQWYPGFTSVTDGNWHHLVVTYDNPSDIVKIYVDGKLDVEGSKSWGNVQGPILIGAGTWSGWPEYNYNGSIDEVRIYPYARTAAQIKKDYNAGLAGMGGGTEGVGAALGGGGSQKWMTDGLVGYWKMDEASWTGVADEVVDASGAGNHGVRAGDATTAAGKFGKGGTFDGTGDYVNCGNDSSLNITDAITIEAWVKANANGVYQGIAGKLHAGTKTGWGIRKTGSSNKFTFMVGEGGIWKDINSNVAYTDTDWHHIVGKYDGEHITLYVDNILQTDTDTATISDSGNDCLIGQSYTDISNYRFNGSIDQVRIYNRALSPKEVRDLYNFAPGPVLHLKMDEKVSGNAQTLYDISTNENNGTTYYGANATGMDCSVLGKFGTACDFDGTDDYVDCGSDSSLNITDAITVEAWVKPNEWTGFIAKKYSTGPNGWMFGFDPVNENFEANFRDGVYRAYMTTPAVDVPKNQWTHVAATFHSSDGQVLYVNGIQKDSDTTGYSMGDNVNALLKIGCADWHVGAYFNGLIDDVRIYNYARTQKQIIQDMNAGHPAVGSPVGSQVGYWKFDEGYGDTANDSSPQDNDGDLAGACPGAATCPSWTNTGKFNKALIFDGGDYIDCGNDSSLDITDAITISAWVKRGSIDSVQTIAMKRLSGGDMEYYLRFLTNNKVNFGSYDGSYYEVHSISTITSISEWNHLAGVFTGTHYQIYINGVLDNSVANSTNLVSGSGKLSIGQKGEGHSDLFNGTIDEVKIYNYALTEDEVRVEYNQGKAIVLGATGIESDGKTPSFSANREYCVPGDTTFCDPPVAEWNFNEQTGSSAFDTSANNNTGTITDATWTLAGKYDSALSFDGDGDYVDCGAHSSLDITDAITVEAWVKWEGYVQGSGFISKGKEGFLLGYQDSDDGNLAWYIYTTGWVNIPVAVSKNVWHHYVGTYNKNLGSNQMKAYLDGVFVDHATQTGNIVYNAGVCGTKVLIGDYCAGTDHSYFNGTIDHVKIYDYARTPAQVAWSYNRGKPVAHWRFDECQGTTAHDESGNGNTGTITIGGTGTQDDLGACTDGDSSHSWYNGATGKINSALSFDGTDDYVDCGDPADGSLDFGTDNWTVEAWVKPSTMSPVSAIAAKGSYGGVNEWLLYFYSNHIRLCGHGDFTTCIYNTASLLNEWHHYAAGRDGDDGVIFIDGVEVKRAVNFWQGYTITNDKKVTIGARQNGTQAFLNGSIDEVKIYNYALTPEQVRMDYNNGAVNFK